MIDDFTPGPGRSPGRPDTEHRLRPQSIHRPAPGFRTPEEVARDAEAAGASRGERSGTFGSAAAWADSDDELLLPTHAGSGTADKDSVGVAAIAAASSPTPRRLGRLSGNVRLFRRWDVSKKKLLVAGVAAVLVIGGGAAYALTRSHPAPVKPAVAVKKSQPAPPPAPKPILSPLTGMPVTADQQKMPVIGVMIENSPDARPQSGLKDAGVVYEAIAEAGITRFLALYQEAQPANVGPIRSSRPYYLDWAMAFDAAYAHVGGSPDALQRIKDIGVKDMDQFFNPVAYHRITTRYAPHNMYSSLPQLEDLAKSKGYDTSTFTPFVRKAEQPYKAPSSTAASTTKTGTSAKAGASSKTSAPADSRTPANSVNIAISGAYYNVHYDYDSAANAYKRSEGGAPHLDADSGSQLEPKVVIALAMPYSLMADGYHSQYNTQGSGKMFVFQDGTVQTGTWSKGEPKDQFVFKDDSGKDIALNPGQTWITVVGDAGDVTYQ